MLVSCWKPVKSNVNSNVTNKVNNNEAKMKEFNEAITAVSARRMLAMAKRRTIHEDGKDIDYVKLTDKEFRNMLDWLAELRELFYYAQYEYQDRDDGPMDLLATDFEANTLESIAYGKLEITD